jgi:hypothetical protein
MSRVPGMTRPTSAAHIAEARLVRALLNAGWNGRDAEEARKVYRHAPVLHRLDIDRLAAWDPAQLHTALFPPPEGPEAA